LKHLVQLSGKVLRGDEPGEVDLGKSSESLGGDELADDRDMAGQDGMLRQGEMAGTETGGGIMVDIAMTVRRGQGTMVIGRDGAEVTARPFRMTAV
jgi:hypothetical protein